jgi:hypothetical protein
VLFTRFLKYDAAQPRWADRDSFSRPVTARCCSTASCISRATPT